MAYIGLLCIVASNRICQFLSIPTTTSNKDYVVQCFVTRIRYQDKLINAIYIYVDVGVCIKIFIMLKSWRCMCTNVCPWPLCRQSQPEKKKIKNCGVLSLKMAQRAHGHVQPMLFLLTDMDQNEIVLNKIWVFIRLYW